MARAEHDAVVVGSGPNGLAAAVTLAQQGCSVVVLEAADCIGGGARTAELTEPGFRHDICSAIHPVGAASPFFSQLRLERHGLEWVHPELAVAHPLDDGSAGELHDSIDATVAANGEGDGWRRVFGPLVARWADLDQQVLGPPLRVPRSPVPYLRFGFRALPPVTMLSRRWINGTRTGALFAGIAAHANTSLRRPLSSPAGLVLITTGHVGGWPAARGGSQAIADALAGLLRELGGEIVTSHAVRSLDDVPPARARLFDTTPWQLIRIAGDRFPSLRRRYRRYRHGAASFKIDYALSGPVPWTAPAARRAGTVHLGGTVEELVATEQEVFRGRIPERPYVLVTQQSLFDDTRAPAGMHTLWTYCHVPNGCTADMTERIEAQIDRFAPGWRDLVIGRHVTSPSGLEAYNENYVGGDIAGGAPDGLQLLFRPALALDPYKTPADGIWLCSSSTPPGGGVHGMCGHWAARSVLKHLR